MENDDDDDDDDNTIQDSDSPTSYL